MHKSAGRRPIVKFLQGKKGIQFVFEDLVATLKKEIFFTDIARQRILLKMKNICPPITEKIRDQKQLERFVITNEFVSKQKKPRLERATKLVPQQYGLFDYNITQLIYGDKVAFADYNTETAIIIEDPQIAEFQKRFSSCCMISCKIV